MKVLELLGEVDERATYTVRETEVKLRVESLLGKARQARATSKLPVRYTRYKDAGLNLYSSAQQ